MVLLFVCTGNTCRSPMAEGWAKVIIPEIAAQLQIDSTAFSAASAGLAAIDHEPAAANAISVMRSSGIDISQHYARRLTPHILSKTDCVLTMTKRQKQAVLEMGAGVKVFTLGEYAGEDIEIPDPFGGNENEYRECSQTLCGLVSAALLRWMADSAAVYEIE